MMLLIMRHSIEVFLSFHMFVKFSGVSEMDSLCVLHSHKKKFPVEIYLFGNAYSLLPGYSSTLNRDFLELKSSGVGLTIIYGQTTSVENEAILQMSCDLPLPGSLKKSHRM